MKSTLWAWVKDLLILGILLGVMWTFAKPSLVYGDSMLPTLESFQLVFAERFSLINKPPQIGEIVIIKTEEPLIFGIKKNFIKRVVAVGGDRLQMVDYQVFRNNQMLREGYTLDSITPGEFYGVIPDGHVYVMGDNRRNSEDSRNLGPIPLEDVIGRVYFRLWPLTLWSSDDAPTGLD